jgi:hypothetical protein
MSVDLRNLKMEDVKFVYFRRNGGTITVAYTVLNREEKHGIFKVVFDYSSCSPKDRFDRKVGRNMAFGRLAKRMKLLNSYEYVNGYSDLEFDDNPNQGLFKQTVEHLERHLFYSGDYLIPRWYTRKVELPDFDNKNVSLAARSIINVGTLNKRDANILKRLIDTKTYNYI